MGFRSRIWNQENEIKRKDQTPRLNAEETPSPDHIQVLQREGGALLASSRCDLDTGQITPLAKQWYLLLPSMGQQQGVSESSVETDKKLLVG